MSLDSPVLSGPGAGRTVTYRGGSSAELKLAGQQSAGDYVVVEWRLHCGDEPPIHTHTREDETVYVLAGAITAFVGDQRLDVQAGSYAALPKASPMDSASAATRHTPAYHPRSPPARSTSSSHATTATRTPTSSGYNCTTPPPPPDSGSGATLTQLSLPTNRALGNWRETAAKAHSIHMAFRVCLPSRPQAGASWRHEFDVCQPGLGLPVSDRQGLREVSFGEPG